MSGKEKALINAEYMENIRRRIQKSGRFMQTVCRIAIILLFISIAAVIVVMPLAYSHDTVADYAQDILTQEFSNSSFNIVMEGDGTPEVRQLIIWLLGTLHIIYRVMLMICLFLFDRLLGGIAKGEQPFVRSTAKKLKVMSYFLLPVAAISSLVTGIGLFLVTRFMSYLFEYGAYLQDQADEKSRIQEEMILSFAEITENKSEQTGQHVRRVAEYSKILAEEMGLPPEEVERVRLASTMHDVGKLLVPTEILEKPARLTDEEFAEIKKHSAYGEMLLRTVEGEIMELARSIALEHHERVDGTGYPDGKAETAIGLEGRIVAVADVYDALTSKRSYKEAWDERRAYEEIVAGAGSQFDVLVVKAFQRAYKRINEVREKFADKETRNN